VRSVDRVAYRPRQRVLLVARLECRLAAGSRPRNGDKRRSRVLWAVREPTSHWGLRHVVRGYGVLTPQKLPFLIHFLCVPYNSVGH